MFQKLSMKMAMPSIDLFTSWLPLQLPKCVAWSKDLACCEKCNLENLERGVLLSVPLFCLVTQVLNKKERGKTKILILIRSYWYAQLWLTSESPKISAEKFLSSP